MCARGCYRMKGGHLRLRRRREGGDLLGLLYTRGGRKGCRGGKKQLSSSSHLPTRVEKKKREGGHRAATEPIGTTRKFLVFLPLSAWRWLRIAVYNLAHTRGPPSVLSNGAACFCLHAASTSVPLPHLISNAFSWGQRSCVRVRPSFKAPPHPRIEIKFPRAAPVMTGGLGVCVCVYCAPPRYWEPFRDCRKETTPLMILPPFAREAAMSGAPLHFSCASIADTLFCSHLFCSFSFGGRP